MQRTKHHGIFGEWETSWLKDSQQFLYRRVVKCRWPFSGNASFWPSRSVEMVDISRRLWVVMRRWTRIHIRVSGLYGINFFVENFLIDSLGCLFDRLIDWLSEWVSEWLIDPLIHSLDLLIPMHLICVFIALFFLSVVDSPRKMISAGRIRRGKNAGIHRVFHEVYARSCIKPAVRPRKRLKSPCKWSPNLMIIAMMSDCVRWKAIMVTPWKTLPRATVVTLLPFPVRSFISSWSWDYRPSCFFFFRVWPKIDWSEVLHF